MRNSFSLLPLSFSSSLLVTFFSAASTIPALCGGGYFFSLSTRASSSFFFAASLFSFSLDVEAEADVEVEGVSSTAIASVDSDEAVNGFADGPGARMPTTVPAWPARRGRAREESRKRKVFRLVAREVARAETYFLRRCRRHCSILTGRATRSTVHRPAPSVVTTSDSSPSAASPAMTSISDRPGAPDSNQAAPSKRARGSGTQGTH
jgi:hypothetical protein